MLSQLERRLLAMLVAEGGMYSYDERMDEFEDLAADPLLCLVEKGYVLSDPSRIGEYVYATPSGKAALRRS